jgi:hypothetical protein
MNLTPNQRFTALLALYNHTYDELSRYRNLEWTITSYMVVLLGTIATTSQTEFVRNLNAWLRFSLLLFVVVLYVYGLTELWFLHSQLTIQRNQRRKIERILEFYEENRYLSGQSLLNREWMVMDVPFRQGLKRLIVWWTLLFVFVIYAFISLWPFVISIR